MNDDFEIQKEASYSLNLLTNDVIIAWLGRQDSNLRMTGPKPVALPLGDDPL